jgi:hypothetical protein
MGAVKAFQLHCRTHDIDDGWQPRQIDKNTFGVSHSKLRRALSHFERGYFTDYGDLSEIAEKLGGEVGYFGDKAFDGFITCAAPGEPWSDRSMVIKINAHRPRDFFVYHCPENVSDRTAQAHIRELLNLPEQEPEEAVAEQIARAIEIWEAALPPEGTIVESYLRSRRLPLPPLPVIRFVPELYHADAGSRWPAMVALMTDVNDHPTAVQLTYLKHDGSGKAPLAKNDQRRTRGSIKGSGIRLATGEGRLLVGEGMETVLSVYVETKRPAIAAGPARNLAALQLPTSFREITILEDGDDAGRKGSAAAAHKWRKERRSVAFYKAPDGKDFNDLLMEEAQP